MPGSDSWYHYPIATAGNVAAVARAYPTRFSGQVQAFAENRVAFCLLHHNTMLQQICLELFVPAQMMTTCSCGGLKTGREKPDSQHQNN